MMSRLEIKTRVNEILRPYATEFYLEGVLDVKIDLYIYGTRDIMRQFEGYLLAIADIGRITHDQYFELLDLLRAWRAIANVR